MLEPVLSERPSISVGDASHGHCGDPGDTACPEDVDATGIDYSAIDEGSRDLIRDAGAKFLLRMKNGLNLSQHACDEMIAGVTELFGVFFSNLH